MKQMLAIAGLALIMASCNTNYEKTKSGLTYKVFKGKSNNPIKAGMFAKLNIAYLLSPKDTVLNSTYGKVPLFTAIDTSAATAYSFMELLPKCSEGDSVIFTINVDTLYNRKQLQYNELFKKGDLIKCKMSVVKVYSVENDVRADYEKEMNIEKDREVKDVAKYLSKKSVKAEKTKNGAFVEIQNAGDAGAKIQNGKVATIMYRGYLQENGKVFDTNMDSSKGHTAPIDVVLGAGKVIPGWEEALPYFGKGGKGKIYVPAMLGYGAQGSPGVIPPYANLVFEIEIVDVKDAPPQMPGGGQQGMNSLTPEQIQQLQQQMQQQRGRQQQGQQPGAQQPGGGH